MRPALVCALLAIPATLASAELGPWVYRETPIRALRMTSLASYYTLEGLLQANGRRHRGSRLTAAHRTLPMGSRRVLCRQDRPRVCVEVVIEDRGPWVAGRDFDLSRAAARRLGMLREGVVVVKVGGVD